MSDPNPNQSIQVEQAIKARVMALIQVLILENDLLEQMVNKSKFNASFKPVILSLVRRLPSILDSMLANIDDDDLRRGLVQARDEFIPFLLDEKNCNCMTYNIPGPHHNSGCPLHENPFRE